LTARIKLDRITEREEVLTMKEWLERLTDAQRARFAELGEHISLITLAKFCEDEGLELPDVSLDVTK